MRRDRSAILLAAGFGLVLAACGGPRPESGRWDAWLDSPGGRLRFGLEIVDHGDRIEAFLVNGSERIEVPRTEWERGRLLLGIAPYDSRLTATSSEGGTRLDGWWTKTVGAGRVARLGFHATRRRAAPAALPAPGPATLAGRYRVEFASEDDPAVGIFRAASDGSLEGTFLTTTGDYRFLAGEFDGERMFLSCFDGAHAFLFTAKLQPDGTLAGDFWSRDTWHDTWTARRDPDAELPDPFALTARVDEVRLADVVYPDLDGRPRPLDDPEFEGAARIIEVFGSWCPNCNDASRYLVELDRRYRARGLRILGLAFELTGDAERDAAQLRTYAAHHGIEFPILLAGTADKAEASTALPLVDRIRAYPTTLFLDSRGRVRAVHTGFAGPATGEAHDRLRAAFEELIERLLDEYDPAAHGTPARL